MSRVFLLVVVLLSLASAAVAEVADVSGGTRSQR